MLAAYSAINFGHRHPRLVAAAQRQLERVTLVSRAFEHDQFGPFCAELAALAGMDMVLPMNTGAEAVETAIKTARKWGYEVKGVPDGEAVIVAFDGNFHGRTTTIVSFSTDPDARASFGPYTPGFRVVPYGDLAALAAAMDERRGRRAGRADPGRGRACWCRRPASWPAVRELCTAHGALMIADEIQSGLGRTGTTFACEHEDVVPDMYLLGKALGGGIVPVSAVVSSQRRARRVQAGPARLHVRRQPAGLRGRPRGHRDAVHRGVPGAVGQARRAHARPAGRAAARARCARSAAAACGPGSSSRSLPGREACERLAERGVLAKDTHGTTIRLAPPLVISEEDLDWAIDQLERHPGGRRRPELMPASVLSLRRRYRLRSGSAACRRAGSADADDLADHDAVVTAVVHGGGPALQRGQRVVQDRRAGQRARVVRDPASWPSSGRPRVASQRAVFSASSSSTDTAQVPAASTASWKRAIFSAQNSTSSGSSDTEVKALTVIA